MASVRRVPNDSPKGLAVWQLDLTLALILDDLSADIPVAELASRCGLSRSYFARAFKASTGLPPHQWLMRHRVERCRQMLEASNESIVEIALRCGFADQSHLTRVFHSLTGASPAAWRRRRQACAAASSCS